ncbi:tRNA-guanine transglycosylase DpdA [Lysobacter enzymogenes]|uniref:tRNA-guanine transglycosylase DpdA n=1 Tax=Lysobacter enzymogenes TaxID=69 RepID=UPI0037498F11
MKFIYADAMDFVDPDFDFANDRTSEGRIVQWDDEYPHEFLDRAPYDGILISRGVVGDVQHQGKYTLPQMMRFRREGARKFIRYAEDKYPGSLLFGDCGAFTYRDQKLPPYTPVDTIQFYAEGGFSHGCSVDHIIFDFDEGSGRSREEMPDATLERYDLTLQLASEFHAESKRLKSFTPMGVIQGWSAPSMAWAATQLVHMGYDYLAVGGLVPLKVPQIHAALAAIREAIPSRVRLHLLGFGKIENLAEFERYGIASFDTTSPLLRAFKDAAKNYFARDPAGELSYYTAIRVPQARENNKLKAKARRGVLNQETALHLETIALDSIRKHVTGKLSIEKTLDNVLAYWKALNWREDHDEASQQRMLLKQRGIYRRTLKDQPWRNCDCRVCREGGVEALLFRSSNRNKRRGMHNLHVFYQHLLAHRLSA